MNGLSFDIAPGETFGLLGTPFGHSGVWAELNSSVSWTAS